MTTDNHLAVVWYRCRVARGGGRVMCDLCRKRPATELHHIIRRGTTMRNPEARRLSECKELMALLCQDCHTGSENAHNPITDTRLIEFNLKLYGAAKVKEQYEAVQAALSFPLPPFSEGENELTAQRAEDIGQHYGMMIVDFLRTQPNGGCDDMRDAQMALGLNEQEFKYGTDWLEAKKIITFDHNFNPTQH